MSNTSIRVLALSMTALFGAPLVQAAETGFYVGGFYGTADSGQEKEDFFPFADAVYTFAGYTPDIVSSTFDDKSKGYGFIGGYRLFQNLAVESGFMDLGKVEFKERSSGNLSDGVNTLATDATLSVNSKVSGISVSALGILPISYRAEIYARGGLMFSSHKRTFYYSDVVGPLRNDPSEGDTDFLAGVGVSYTLAEIYAVRAEFIRVFDAGDEAFGEADIDLLTVGVTVKF